MFTKSIARSGLPRRPFHARSMSTTYLDGRSDLAMKKLFVHKELVLPLLNDAFVLAGSKQIVDLDIVESKMLGPHNTEKNTTFGFKCTAKSGARFNVEIRRGIRDNFYKRTLSN